MKAHIGVDADSGLVHSVVGTAASVNEAQGRGANVARGHASESSQEAKPFIETQFVAERVEETKTSIRAKVAHPFRVLKH